LPPFQGHTRDPRGEMQMLLPAREDERPRLPKARPRNKDTTADADVVVHESRYCGTCQWGGRHRRQLGQVERVKRSSERCTNCFRGRRNKISGLERPNVKSSHQATTPSVGAAPAKVSK